MVDPERDDTVPRLAIDATAFCLRHGRAIGFILSLLVLAAAVWLFLHIRPA